MLEDTKIAPNEMVVLPFNKDGLMMLDLEGKEGLLHQLAPAQLFEKGEIRYEGTPADLAAHPELRQKYLMV